MITGRYGKGILLLVGIASLLGGGAIFFHELSGPASSEAVQVDERLSFKSSTLQPADLPGFFPADSARLYSFRYDEKSAFSLAVVQYRNALGAKSSAVLFPKEAQDGVISSSQTGLRNEIWQSASKAISKHAPEEALFLSWWDDGQRIQYLSGRDAWLQKPGEQTFSSFVWQALRSDLIEASNQERERLQQMARWLTMDADKALSEIVEYFGKSRPIYLVVNNDVLLRLSEIKAYGGSDLGLKTRNIPAGNNLHGDIAQVKRWAHEAGEGNYLAHKEGHYYRTWVAAGNSKNTLLVRLLPFIDSLKKLPEGVSLVYQSGWGGYLSIYKLEI